MDSLLVYRWPKKLALVERLRKVQFGLSNGNGFLKTPFPEQWPMS